MDPLIPASDIQSMGLSIQEDFAGDVTICGITHKAKEWAALGRWQPMDTAPKDGLPVFAWRSDWGYPRWVNWRENSRTKTAFWNDLFEHDHYENETNPPVCWCSIPAISDRFSKP